MSETIEQKCLAKGVKLTDQRKIIAQVMSESTDHPNVDELYNRNRISNPRKTSWTSVNVYFINIIQFKFI